MKAQEYNLTGNEKFSVWYTTMMMMTSAQLDPDSKARIMNMAKIKKMSLTNTDHREYSEK